MVRMVWLPASGTHTKKKTDPKISKFSWESEAKQKTKVGMTWPPLSQVLG